MYTITREIGIDMAHRVTHHGSKCRNLHGHRYTIQAVCHGGLFDNGEQQGMVLDFGFLKDEMMNQIDAICDHGMTLWIDDPWLRDFIDESEAEISDLKELVKSNGFVALQGKFGKLLLIDQVPTAENLAKHWYEQLVPRIHARSEGNAKLAQLIVWETPNCAAAYPATAE